MGWIGSSSLSHGLAGVGDLVRLGDYVVPRALTWKVEGDKGDPDLAVDFEVRNGRPECVGVRVSAKPGGRQVRTSDLQMLALDAITVSAFGRSALHSTYDPETNVTTMEPIRSEQEFWAAINAADTAVKAPHRGTTQAELEQVAKVYRENVQGRPVAAVHIALGYGSERTAARRIEQARAAGLLPPTTPGKRKA